MWLQCECLGKAACRARPGHGCAFFPTALQCCTFPHGERYTCAPCMPALLQALACVGPRRVLLRPTLGCGPLLLPPPPPPPPLPQQQQLPGCSVPTAAALEGTWVQTADAGLASLPGAPGRVFRLPSDSSSGSCEQRWLGSAEVPRCLWASGIDRVVVSGDSTTRMLYNRLYL